MRIPKFKLGDIVQSTVEHDIIGIIERVVIFMNEGEVCIQYDITCRNYSDMISENDLIRLIKE